MVRGSLVRGTGRSCESYAADTDLDPRAVGSRHGRPKAERMTKPTILTVDDDPLVAQAISRDLRAKYGHDYRIVRSHC